MERYSTLKRIVTLIGVKLYHNYVITKENYHLLKTLEHNRGGEDVSRWKNYVKAYKKGKFNFDLVTFNVGIDGTVYEGNHKLIALMHLGEDIKISIVPPQKIEDIADFNSSPNSKWKPEQQFGTAISMGSKTAILMNVLKVNALNAYHLKPNQLSAPEMYGLLIKNTKSFSSGQFAPTLRDFNNTSLTGVAASDEYEQLVMKYAEMKYHLKNFERAYKIAKTVMELHFDETEDFDVYVFVEALKTQPLVFKANVKVTIEVIKEVVKKLYRNEVKFQKAA